MSSEAHVAQHTPNGAKVTVTRQREQPDPTAYPDHPANRLAHAVEKITANLHTTSASAEP